MRRKLAIVLGVIAVGGVWFVSRGRQTIRVSNWCNAVAVGESRGSVLQGATAAGFEVMPVASGDEVDVRLRLGQFAWGICTVSFRDDRVVGTRFEGI